MLQRRIGTKWTSSGWSVAASPRANSRTDRTVLLAFRKVRIEPESISGRCRGSHPPHSAANPQRMLENRPDPEPARQAMAGDRVQAGRGDAAAVGAIRVAAELAGRDVAFE